MNNKTDDKIRYEIKKIYSLAILNHLDFQSLDSISKKYDIKIDD